MSLGLLNFYLNSLADDKGDSSLIASGVFSQCYQRLSFFPSLFFLFQISTRNSFCCRVIHQGNQSLPLIYSSPYSPKSVWNGEKLTPAIKHFLSSVTSFHSNTILIRTTLQFLFFFFFPQSHSTLPTRKLQLQCNHFKPTARSSAFARNLPNPYSHTQSTSQGTETSLQSALQLGEKKTRVKRFTERRRTSAVEKGGRKGLLGDTEEAIAGARGSGQRGRSQTGESLQLRGHRVSPFVRSCSDLSSPKFKCCRRRRRACRRKEEDDSGGTNAALFRDNI